MITNILKLSDRVNKVKVSPTLELDAKVKKLKQQGIDIINFGVGEPDFDTPNNIKKAAILAINNGFTKYCPVTGTSEIKEAIIEKLKRDNSLVYKSNEIIVSCGAKHSLYNLFQAILNNGDEVIIPSPYWVSYPDMVVLAGGNPIILKTDDTSGFKVNPKDIEKHITDKTKAFIINSPSNPSGVTYNYEELKKISEICLKNNILIISDEIYEKLVFDDFKFTSIAEISAETKENTIIVNGVSKAYAMTGWRIGYAVGNENIISAMNKIQSQSTSNATSISIKAAVEALNGPQNSVEIMKKEFEKRRNYIVKRLNSINGISCRIPEGAFYVFPNIKKFIGCNLNNNVLNSDIDFANYLLDMSNIAVVPGSVFGTCGYIRLSYATSMENIERGMNNLEKVCK
ncbi:MAG: pyridoxal phosphate-dependent aminotransferase [Endomicrobium sp.]|jgi:aspartate aminotransferase|nr:pyridoxal phosphate-dependent aminotransferase [Endomicrobium sp.]